MMQLQERADECVIRAHDDYCNLHFLYFTRPGIDELIPIPLCLVDRLEESLQQWGAEREGLQQAADRKLGELTLLAERNLQESQMRASEKLEAALTKAAGELRVATMCAHLLNCPE